MPNKKKPNKKKELTLDELSEFTMEHFELNFSTVFNCIQIARLASHTGKLPWPHDPECKSPMAPINPKCNPVPGIEESPEQFREDAKKMAERNKIAPALRKPLKP
jgi:hypothetical protein